MIIVTRKYMCHPATGGCYPDTEFKVFADDDIQGLQDYLDKYKGTFDFKKL